MMKTRLYITIGIIIAFFAMSCDDKWDSHYSQDDMTIIENDEVAVVNQTIQEYLASTASLKTMYDLFTQMDVIKDMNANDQLYTVFVVANDAFHGEELSAYVAKGHISNISLSPSSLLDDQRILVWNGKYLNVNIDEPANQELQSITSISFNEVPVKTVTKAKNGYIYEVENLIEVPKSMFEIIQELDDNYSIFREMILSRNEETFDEANSAPIGVDETGNTIYDTVRITTNPYFLARGFDLMSEGTTATMLIPSNDLITQALQDARDLLEKCNFTRVDSILENWFIQSTFFDTEYSAEDFLNTEDFTSVFGSQWRNTVQQVNTAEPIKMSNGVAYYIDWMKIPVNKILIYRIKDFFHHYPKCSAEQKAEFYKSDDLVFDKIREAVAAWTPIEGVWPAITNTTADFLLISNDEETQTTGGDFTMEFTPYYCRENGSGGYDIAPYLFPPGEYKLTMGLEQYLTYSVEILYEGKSIFNVLSSSFNATTYHYDRGSGGYPEGYDPSLSTHSRKTYYDLDGGTVNTIVVPGDEPASIKITFKGKGADYRTSKQIVFHHWCMIPTSNNY